MTPDLDIVAVIKTAKLGISRKDAQVNTCAVFAAALYDLLTAHEIPCQMFTASGDAWGGWYHSVVEVEGVFYDSMGEFSEAALRARSKIHPKVQLSITLKPDTREECYEAEFDELHAFYFKQLTKAADRALQSPVENDGSTVQATRGR